MDFPGPCGGGDPRVDGARRNAMSSALSARCRSFTVLTAQPTTICENRSTRPERNSRLHPATSSVVSPTQRSFGCAVRNPRSNTFTAIGWSCPLIVVERYRRRARATSPSARIKRATRRLPTAMPCSASSGTNRGLPFVRRLRT